MGQYCELYIKNYPISITDNEIDRYLLSLFTSDDLITYSRKIKERKQLLFGRGDNNDSERNERAVEYKSTVRILKDRLELIGFTIEKVKAILEESKEEAIARLKEYIKEKRFSDSPEYETEIKEEIELLQNSKFEDFLKAVKEIFENEYRYKVSVDDIPKKGNELVLFLLKRGYGLENFPHGYDERVLLRILLEVSEPDTPVVYDITELIDEYEDDELALEEIEEVYDDLLNQETPFEYQLNHKILILTEGSTDIEILRESLHILYPHLVTYFTFMDFGISNASGSASSLVASIKSFVGAGLDNRIIAIFDNDTAAEAAIRGLNKTEIPHNIKILKFPYLDFAKKYPTIGPTGIMEMDINNLACSIELYLGKEIITKDGEFYPIHWKGYDPGTKQYQGEILEKDYILKKFKEKIRECNNDPSKIENYDWEGLNLIFKTIFNAFN